MIDHYDWPGGREAMLRFGPDDGPVVIFIPALFEEHNRTRHLAVAIARGLERLGLASLLPDLPGQGESVVPTQAATLDSWRHAVKSLSAARLAVRPVVLASLRGAAIVDSVAGLSGVWRLSPVTGRAMLTDLQRAEAVSGRRDVASFRPGDPPIGLVGNLIAWPLYSTLLADDALTEPPAPLRTVRLNSDPAPADARYPGAPLWRRSEPGSDPTLAKLLAADIADWVRTCVG